MSIHQSVFDTKCICKLKGYFLRSQVDEIWHEDRCSDKAHSHRTLLKIILMDKLHLVLF